MARKLWPHPLDPPPAAAERAIDRLLLGLALFATIATLIGLLGLS